MLQVRVEGGRRLVFARPGSAHGFGVSFQRTLRIPDDGKAYPLPPGLGALPVRRVRAYAGRVPDHWLKTGGVFLPLYQREAVWLSFQARHWRPNAVKVAAGKVNAVSGGPWVEEVAGDWHGKQDYLTCPPQPWLDGFNTGSGTVRQFVAMPLGMGYTVEGQVTGKEEHGGVQLVVYEPKPGRFPEEPPPIEYHWRSTGAIPRAAPSAPARAKSMGLAAGGSITQKIYPDPHGLTTWDAADRGRVFVHLVNSQMWTEITGEPPPPTPVSAQSYTAAGLPWFDLYDEPLGDVPASAVLAAVKPVAAKDADHGFVGVDDDDTVAVPDSQRVGIGAGVVEDGVW